MTSVGREPRAQLSRSRAASDRQEALLDSPDIRVYENTVNERHVSDAWLPRDRPQKLRQWIEVEEAIELKVRRDYERRKESIAEPLDRTAGASDSRHGRKARGCEPARTTALSQLPSSRPSRWSAVTHLWLVPQSRII